jgi:hypothetical protein
MLLLYLDMFETCRFYAISSKKSDEPPMSSAKLETVVVFDRPMVSLSSEPLLTNG